MQSGQFQNQDAGRDQPTITEAEDGVPNLRRRGFVCSCLGLLGGAHWHSEQFGRMPRSDDDATVGLLVMSDQGLLLRNDTSTDTAGMCWRIPSTRILTGETPEDAALRIASLQAGLSSCSVEPVEPLPVDDLAEIATHIRLMRTDDFELAQTPQSDLGTQFFSRNSCTAIVRDGEVKDLATGLGILAYLCETENMSEMRTHRFRNDPIW